MATRSGMRLTTVAGGPPATVVNLIPERVATPSCYVQGLAGAAVDAVRETGAALPASASVSGWTAGVGAGCDLRLQRAVIGALARVEAPVDMDGSLIRADYSWTAALRGGYLITPTLLAYGIIGYSGTELRLADIDVDRRGLVVGAGMEVAVSAHWALTAEYTQTGLGRVSDGITTLEPVSHRARLGVSYRFNSLMGD